MRRCARSDHERADRDALHPRRDGPRDAPTTATGLLAVVGIFDVGGTIASGWFTDRVDPRMLLLAYYTLRGVGLAVLPSLLSPHTTPGTWVVFGWVFASHQIGAAVLSVSIRRVAPRPDVSSAPDGEPALSPVT